MCGSEAIPLFFTRSRALTQLRHFNIDVSVFEFGAIESALGDPLARETYDQNGRYYKLQTGLQKAVVQYRKGAPSSGAAAEQILRTLLSRLPGARVAYAGVLDTAFSHTLIRLPDRVRDVVVGLSLGW